MFCTTRNIETDHAHGDPAAGTGTHQEEKKDNVTSYPKESEPERSEIQQPIRTSTWNTKSKTNENEKANECTSSIEQLQNESAKLLQSQTLRTDTFTATIFDLRTEDRKKVGELINELAFVKENLAQLEANFEILSEREEKYKAKSNQLMKKVDVLNEKCQKLEDEKSQMKERHYESLTTLQKTVTNISEQFELSAKKMETLTESNALFQNENKRLQGKISTLESHLYSLEKTNQQLSIKLLRQKSRPLTETPKSKKLEKTQRSKSKKNKTPISQNTQDFGDYNADVHHNNKFRQSLSSEEEILHDLFFRF